LTQVVVDETRIPFCPERVRLIKVAKSGRKDIAVCEWLTAGHHLGRGRPSDGREHAYPLTPKMTT